MKFKIILTIKNEKIPELMAAYNVDSLALLKEALLNEYKNDPEGTQYVDADVIIEGTVEDYPS